MDTRRSCLVVVDVQRDYFSTDGKCATKFGWDLHEADATAAAIGAFVESVRGKIDIVFLMNEERTDGYAPNLAPVLPEDQLCLIGTPGHELYRVSAAPEDAIITKNHPSGFYAPR